MLVQGLTSLILKIYNNSSRKFQDLQSTQYTLNITFSKGKLSLVREKMSDLLTYIQEKPKKSIKDFAKTNMMKSRYSKWSNKTRNSSLETKKEI